MILTSLPLTLAVAWHGLEFDFFSNETEPFTKFEPFIFSFLLIADENKQKKYK